MIQVNEVDSRGLLIEVMVQYLSQIFLLHQKNCSSAKSNKCKQVHKKTINRAGVRLDQDKYEDPWPNLSNTEI